ncbi:MAG: efflux RND transporter periplasmic adaptor subunit [Deltaproteobacteria bacterium]
MKFITLIIAIILPLIPLTLHAQGHAGHGAPSAPAAVEKPKAATPQTKAQTQGQQSVPAVQEAPQVEIPPDLQRRIGVKTVKVAVKSLQKTIRTVGRIEIDERRQATVNTKIEGWIEKLYVDYTGRYVRKGEPLAEIYSPELLATQQEFINTKKWAARQTSPASKDNHNHGAQEAPVSVMKQLLDKDATATLDAARQRLRLWDISEKQIKKIEETGQPVRTLTLFSPVSGYITQKMAISGMKVMPGEKLFDVADLSQVWIVADIYEYELAAIRIGQPVKINLNSLPGREWTSRIDYIYPVFSAETRTAKVRLTLPNPGGQLKPQMFTNVVIRIDLGSKLMIPDSAVLDTGKGQVVYVDRGEGYFEPREVQTGIRAEGAVEILRGLKAGEKVASAANFLIDSEAQLKGIKPLSNPK